MLEVQSVSRRFGDVVALDDVSFSVPAGQLCGFLGPNGAGKTTAMRIIMGITRPDRGHVRWQGSPIGLDQRLTFGYMPEERGLYPKMKAREQLVYFGRLHGLDAPTAEERAGRWLARVGLADRADSALQELSLGNQQRVQLAAALVHDPRLLVLDEPFSGLDPLAVDVMSDVLREQAAAGVAVLFSSHQLDLVEDLCESVAVVAEGRLVLSGDVVGLKREGKRRLLVGVDQPAGTDPLAWVRELAGVTPMDVDHDEVLLVLDDQVDADAVLAAAQRAGRLTRFAPALPSLTELFRDAVLADDRLPDTAATLEAEVVR